MQVVLTNHMTTRIGGQSGRERSELIPALGEKKEFDAEVI